MEDQLSLSALISSVRRELDDAGKQLDASGADALLDLQEVELELQFTVAQDTKTGGKLDLKVFSIGADDTIKDSQVQKMKVKYTVAPAARERSLPGSRAHSSGVAGSAPDDVPPLPDSAPTQ